MRWVVVFVFAFGLVGCRDNQVVGAENACAEQLYSSYDPKILDQCVNVCIKCNRGVMTTCSTSCRMKGAQ
jgi:hypothetical protein